MNDTVILKFEVESNLSDTSRTMLLSKQVSDHMKTFKGEVKLMNIGVEYIWNKEQKTKQSEEFLKEHPDYDKGLHIESFVNKEAENDKGKTKQKKKLDS